MKIILKTLNKKFSLDYEDTFNTKKNLEIRSRLIPELQKSMAPNYHPSVTQLTKWLKSLHKSRRVQKKMPNKIWRLETNSNDHMILLWNRANIPLLKNRKLKLKMNKNLNLLI